jgi:hypothetical protein
LSTALPSFLSKIKELDIFELKTNELKQNIGLIPNQVVLKKGSGL